MNVLVAVLTSHDINRLERALKSIEEQHAGSYDFNYEILILVNTTDPGYYSKVCSRFRKSGYNIIQTKSNGFPGKGRNSVIDFFVTLENTTHLILLDGDDFFYPTAFKRIQECINQGADVLGILLNDWVADFKKESSYIPIEIKKDRWLYTWGPNQFDHYESHTYDKLFTPPSIAQNYARIVMISKKACSSPLRPYYPEDLPLSEDYIANLWALAGMLFGEYNYFTTSVSDIYVYDFTNDQSVMHQYRKKSGFGNTDYDKIFMSNCRILQKILSVGLSSVPFIHIKDVILANDKKLEFLKESV